VAVPAAARAEGPARTAGRLPVADRSAPEPASFRLDRVGGPLAGTTTWPDQAGGQDTDYS
jgi:hypothetical protein